jgi:2-oxoglutarate dehydrogenase E2 component (dihydrolipoamide succinyltransferase)
VPPAGEQGATGDSQPVLMPELGESVTEGTVTRWLKKVGDAVEVDEPLVEVSTDKVDTEIPSPVAGTLISITAEEDVTVSVGGELARIGTGPDSPGCTAGGGARTATRGRGGETRAASHTRTGTRAASRTRARAGGRRVEHAVRHPAGAKARCREQH